MQSDKAQKAYTPTYQQSDNQIYYIIFIKSLWTTQ